eukprot:1488381-Pyramimonas_sp.AAC.1
MFHPRRQGAPQEGPITGQRARSGAEGEDRARHERQLRKQDEHNAPHTTPHPSPTNHTPHSTS